MTLTFKPLHPLFVAEAGNVDLTSADDATLQEVRRGMDQYGVLVFRNQAFTDDQQLAFAERFDGRLHAKTSSSVLEKNRFGNEALSDISNVGRDGQLLAADDRRRMSALANRLWHTDASFVDPAGRYSMLSARVVPPVDADTQFADMRSAYDELDANAVAVDLVGVGTVRFAGYDDVVAMKTAAGRRQDEEDLARLREARVER